MCPESAGVEVGAGGGFGDHGHSDGNLNCRSGKDAMLNKAKGRTLGKISV